MGERSSADIVTVPGAIDLHVHLREPGTNPAETIYGGTLAAAMGGFVYVGDMPNNPGNPTWSRNAFEEKISIAEHDAAVAVSFHAGSQPESDNIGEFKSLAELALALKLYGDPTTGNDKSYDAWDFQEIVGEWHSVAPNEPIMFHAGADNLEDMIYLVAREHGHHLHVCQVNSGDQVDLVQEAKDKGLPVTCGVCPHHLLKTSHDVLTQGTLAEMKPPLAHQDEAEYLMRLLERGKIDVIESDFAPHTLEAKLDAENTGGHCFGVTGIEHIMPLLFFQVKKGRLSERRLFEAIHHVPKAIMGIETAIDTEVAWDMSGGVRVIRENDIVATNKLSPYVGMLAMGRIWSVKVSGRSVVSAGHQTGLLSKQVVTERGTII